MLIPWAQRWGIPAEAINELQALTLCTDHPTLPAVQAGKNEASVSAQVRREATEAGCRLWRNNVGVLTDERGVPVRFGLCNESKQMNEEMKSSDLIGIRPVVITQAMVGFTIGQFMAREVKKADWRYTGKGRETAQKNYIDMVNAMGGDACFANRRGTV